MTATAAPMPRDFVQPDDPAHLMDRLCALEPARDRFVEVIRPGTRLRLSHTEVSTLAGRAAARLARLGVRAGDAVGICAPNGLAWIVLDLACLRLGAVVAGFEPDKFEASAALAARYGLAALFATTGAEGTLDPDAFLHALETEEVGAAAPPWASRRPEDDAALKFTSGSTGEAKGLAASRASIGAGIHATQLLFDHGPADRLFVFLPLSLLQQRYWIYTALLYGCDLVVTTPTLALGTLAESAPTVVMGVPAFFESLRGLIEAEAALTGCDHRTAARTVTGARIRYLWTGSAPIRRETLDFLHEACRLPIYEGYGMNETCIVTKNHPGAHRPGSAGRPVWGKEVWIDENGVVFVRSRHPVGSAYRFAPEGASERIFRGEDVVCTGDLGRIDADGFLWILGRSDDVIVLEDGRNVMGRPIEEAALALPEIAQCVLAGSGRPHLLALIALAEGADPEEARRRVRALRVPHGARIGDAIVVPPFTEENGLLTSQGKPRRPSILARHREAIDAAYGDETHGRH
ncbi:AMP-binding protein [Salinarimonas sp.]|uniref:AMP-binding protein n=1 Tax=Salinarimonas sp. TaxID=2766526 RepID=UPI0032D8D116